MLVHLVVSHEANSQGIMYTASADNSMLPAGIIESVFRHAHDTTLLLHLPYVRDDSACFCWAQWGGAIPVLGVSGVMILGAT